MTSDGAPYAPIRIKNLIKEAYVISKNCHTPYNEVLSMSMREKDYFLEFLNEEIDKTEEYIQKSKEQLANS